uniref:Uncharacterized protein n=1 Tax=Oryza nivara TaxID=4536 RepID=A0A0E0FMJ9_ORYNI
MYGLQVLADDIQDDAGNVTREGTSVLFKVLSAFAFRDISLTKIESRPHRHRHPIQFVDGANVGTAKHFEYMFYIDFQASMAEVRAVGDTGVHLLPPRARQLPHGHDAMGVFLLIVTR